MMNFLNHVDPERISEEDYGNIVAYSTTESEMIADLGLDPCIDSMTPFDLLNDNECDMEKLAEFVMYASEPNELNPYLGPVNLQSMNSEHDNNRALMNSLPVNAVATEKEIRSEARPVLLSQSVGVGPPQNTAKPSRSIAIVNELEEGFRLRYKSDYFSQNGKNRCPRYVADRHGNHYVTLKGLPDVRSVIRVDWLTVPTESGHRYSMPYKFQQRNESSAVPDSNPIYVDTMADTRGIMKLYLVLIKSKQDELRSLQPLIPFRPLQDAFGIQKKKDTSAMFPLNPKQLIQKYQLDQSQLAFTLCALSSDGNSYIPQWDTTVYSTVLTEVQPNSSKQKTAVCPNCTHVFQLSTGDDDNDNDCIQVPRTNKRKVDGHASTQTTQLPKFLRKSDFSTFH